MINLCTNIRIERFELMNQKSKNIFIDMKHYFLETQTGHRRLQFEFCKEK